MLAQAAEQGYEFKIGIELEYFLVQLNADGTIEIADKLDTLEKPCYDMAGLTRQYDFLTTVSRYCNELGWGNYANDHEDANGQFEQNFEYADALTTCDRAIFFRYMVHTLAEQYGRIATFMPKPFTTLTGNGVPLPHVALEGRRRTSSSTSPTLAASASRSSPTRFIGGLKAHARAYSALTAPTVNSYKRLKLGSTSSGATWSPVWISYGYNNRTQMLRIPAPGRIEDRTVDGSCNPYLAAAAVLASGLDGIANSLDAGEPNSENLYSFSYEELTARGLRSLPANLLEAIGELEQDDVLRAALGRTREDEEYVDYYAAREARRVVPLPRAGERLGSARVPDPLLMCGIVGLFAKSPEIEERLGAHLVAMLAQMSDRGPDSAGVAVYRDPVPDGMTKLTLYSPDERRGLARGRGGDRRRGRLGAREPRRDRRARRRGRGGGARASRPRRPSGDERRAA